jgi:phage terminase small subunit
MDARTMTPKQDRFVAEYLANGLNATQAAVAAGYSDKTAQQQGSRLLLNTEVAAAVAGKTNQMMDKLEITADMVLQEIGKLAFFDPGKLFNSDGSMKQISEIDDRSRASLAGFDVCELFEGSGDQKHAYGLLKKVKFVDKTRNLEMLGRYFKMFTGDKDDDLEVERISTIIMDV